MRRLAPFALAVALLVVPAARAADPIMPVSDVSAGMHCTARSVVRGTAISSFNADVVDVVDQGDGSAAILVRVSGPAVDATGVGPGFSGSPVYCKDGHGVSRNAGAIAEGLGDYGNKLALVTPIQAILGEPVAPPPAARSLSRRERASARPLATPLTVTGLAPSFARRVSAAARARGLAVYAAPAGPLGTFPPQQLRPGASLSAGFSSGDIAFSEIGTVTYTEGNSVWGFGHPIDAAGRRSLLLQDAYVYTVVNNPNGDEGITYKLAAPGHDLGALTGDTLNAVTGTVGPLPATTDLHVFAKDLDTGRVHITQSRVADEIALGSPTGLSPIHLTAPTALADAAVRVLQSDPSRETATLCLTATLAGHTRPLRFCNRYVGDAAIAGNGEQLAADDADAAMGLLDSAQFPGVQVQRVSVDLKLRRGLAQAYMSHGSAAHPVHPGGTLHVNLVARVVRGPERTFRFAVKVPRHLAPGHYRLALSGPGPDGTGDGGGGGEDLASLIAELLGDGSGGGGGGGSEPSLSDLGPASFGDLAAEFSSFGGYDGLSGRFARQGSGGGGTARARIYRDPHFRIGGRATIPVEVTRP